MEIRDQKETPKKQEKKKNGNKVLLIIIALLLIGNGVLIWQLIETKSEVKTIIVQKNEAQDHNSELQAELDSLMLEHESIKTEYTELTDEVAKKDSVILAKAKKIQQLISRQADYWEIKKDLKQLRGMTQGYVKQLDSLYTVNKKLTAENVKIKRYYKQEVEKTENLTKEKEQLTKKVETASVLKAYNISVTPIHIRWIGKQEKPTDKARKTDNIKICFTLSENKLVEAGRKNIFIRIVAPPDNRVLTKKQTNIFVYNGETIQYSITKDIDYQKQSIAICKYWYQNEEFKVGKYHVEIFVDDYRIGSKSFELR